ncbi:SAM-dependent methyltransferase [Flavobacterium sp. 9AF]|uniref:methyltransferase domain-containing protein n=1 Tax=Flavobacterium sp. 9AF TaxID=2653142 RepID=UPI0012EFEECB|nr:methyltransferase domain-containing protein [Flavobacterium sp. 9AF]VXB60940.1 SAM-dependent methyltransferase [Flavobacterium sp. 9AF]
MILNKEYWENRYQNNDTGWDTGTITPPLKEYIDQIKDKTAKILIPGAGNGHEYDYLIEKGFKNTYVIDIANSPIEMLKSKHKDLHNQIVLDDFFNLTNAYDLIIEQTFFCALEPKLREKYATKMHSLLKPKGKIIGLLFDFPLTTEGPPFGGNTDEYLQLFSSLFTIKKLEKAYNSIKPRQGRELFFIFEKK